MADGATEQWDETMQVGTPFNHAHGSHDAYDATHALAGFPGAARRTAAHSSSMPAPVSRTRRAVAAPPGVDRIQQGLVGALSCLAPAAAWQPGARVRSLAPHRRRRRCAMGVSGRRRFADTPGAHPHIATGPHAHDSAPRSCGSDW
ncbi:hypothetical protein HYPSUDRAFT_205041 [Hypholoma sublateritium FD-334 SS-4]|uniref:Uncharacterized protein n=1 Tax=Hypholoma sublateritium (strain FD-334 SS-4) TaxID=945553 RepID=A0A0D2KVX2_HYPSF|nr:hypothetical protein HYPSUDRAFT_205041 [Hypholoma sublateritium FD-334 SS-4]